MKIIEIDSIPVKVEVVGKIARDKALKYKKDGYAFSGHLGQGFVPLKLSENGNYTDETSLELCGEVIIVKTLNFPRNGKLARVILKNSSGERTRYELSTRNQATPGDRDFTPQMASAKDSCRVAVVEKSGQSKIFKFSLKYENKLEIEEIASYNLPFNLGKEQLEEFFRDEINTRFYAPLGMTPQEYWQHASKIVETDDEWHWRNREAAEKYLGLFGQKGACADRFNVLKLTLIANKGKIEVLRSLSKLFFQMYQIINEENDKTDEFDLKDFYFLYDPPQIPKSGDWVNEGKRWWKCPNGHSVRAASNATKIVCEFCKSEKML